MAESIGFVGLGKLGTPMARHLVEAGYDVHVYNRTQEKAEAFASQGGHLAKNPEDAVTRGGTVVSVVWDDAALESIVTRKGFLEGLGEGGVHVSMSTVLPATAKKLAALHAEHRVAYVEAPIFGRPEAAVAKKLWIPIAGPADAKARVRPLLEAMGAQGIFDFGEAVGAATVVKLVGNFLLISAARSMTEGLTLADKSGVDMKAVLDMLTSTLFPSPIYQSYGKVITERLPVMVSEIPRKDLGLFQRTANEVGASSFMAAELLRLIAQRA